MTRLDGRRIALRRLDLEFSRRQLADQVGVSPRLLGRVEDDEPGSAELLTAAHLFALAELLNTDVDGLTSDSSRTDHSEADPDVSVLASFLCDAGGTVSRHAAANALGWTLARVDAAACRADTQLAEVGLTVGRRNGLRLAGVSSNGHDAVAAAKRSALETNGLTTAQTRVLRAVLTDESGAPNGRRAANTLIDLGYLTRAGLIETRHGRFLPSDTFLASFPE